MLHKQFRLLKQTTFSLGKYAVALALLALVARHVGIERIVASLEQVSWFYLLLAFVLGCVAQMIMALRMRYFFQANGTNVNLRFSCILYYVGAFYNFLLPGGIGGDAYKVLIARLRLHVPAAQGIRIMLADRASGLCIVMLWMFASLFSIDLSNIPAAKLLLVLAAICTFLSYLVLCERLLKQPAKTMIAALGYSLVSQCMWIATLAVFWRALGGTHFTVYGALYCAASITGMLPISVGGLGIKEMTFYYGVILLNRHTGMITDPELGVTLSLCLFAMIFLSSLPGVLFIGRVKESGII